MQKQQQQQQQCKATSEYTHCMMMSFSSVCASRTVGSSLALAPKDRMAPIIFVDASPIALIDPVSVSTVISFLAVLSILLAVLICACGGGQGGHGKQGIEKHRSRSRKHSKEPIYQNLSPSTLKKKPGMYFKEVMKLATNDETLRLLFDDPYFCEECALVVYDHICSKWIPYFFKLSVQDKTNMHFYRTEWWTNNKNRLVFPARPEDYDRRSHLAYHKGDGRFDEQCMREFVTKARNFFKDIDIVGAKKIDKYTSSEPFGKPQEQRPPTPAPAPIPTESNMRAAQANPAYQTIWNAKSGVFDKPNALKNIGRTVAYDGPIKAGGAKDAGRTMAYEGPVKLGGGSPQAGKAPTESQMRAAQANPAYQTIWNAKSGVFDKPNALKNIGRTMAYDGPIKSGGAKNAG